MRIGILTLPFNNNYGGYLQAYALMKVLKDMGHDVKIIYRRHNRRPLSYRIKYVIKTLIKIVLGKEHGSLLPNREKEHRKRGELLMPFVDKYICPKTKPLYSTTELIKECKGKFDAVIVGSDQVWRPDYVPNIENFYLDFVKNKNILKIAYAASFGSGNPCYTDSQKQECGKLLEQFNEVSVREESGIAIIHNFDWKPQTPPKTVLDPTMLLTITDYSSLLPIQKNRNKYLLSYVLDKNTEVKRLIEVMCSKLEINDYCVIDTSKLMQPDYKIPSVETWLGAIMNAEYVITDSFHGTVFSIIFNKPFIVFENKGRGSDRFITLLKYFGLENRLVSHACDLNKLSSEIDWIRVNHILSKERETSLNFLSEALHSN